MWSFQTRDEAWEIATHTSEWDLIIIGGGITGAGILREAVRRGWRALLVETHDFASGTSSRSSKLVHGGFRYLKNGQIRLTYESVRERERLLSEGRGLVTRLGFLLANFKGDSIPGWVFGAGLICYDLLAFQWGHRRYDAYDMRDLCPTLTDTGLEGGFRYFDAQTDDARLVLRLIQEAVRAGGVAINYARAETILRRQDGTVCGAAIRDLSPEANGRTVEVKARVVINASGAWADDLRREVGGAPRLRKLRGSHLIFPAGRIPLTRAVSFLHPVDSRPVFAFPWEGVAIIGTTDLDLDGPLSADPAITAVETDYLLSTAQYAFPCLELSPADIQATFSGIRPVVNTSKSDPSKESREHVLWRENGLLTVAGGKLTTFRLMAVDALKRVGRLLPEWNPTRLNRRLLDPPPEGLNLPEQLSPAARLRLIGRHGRDSVEMLSSASADELTAISGSPALWSELRWAARAEAVVHLDDLLLRRVRLGLLLPQGGIHLLGQIRKMVQPELGWDDERWNREVEAYSKLWKKCYHIPA